MITELQQKGYREDDLIYQLFMSTQKMDFSVQHSIMYLKYLEKELLQEDDPITRYIVHPQLANSLFLTIYGEFEKLLHDLCNGYKKELKLLISVDDLKNKGVLRSINYLSKLVLIPNIKSIEHYDLITHWNRIRNIIAHDTGIVNEPNQWKSIKRLNLITSNSEEENRVSLTFDNCKDFYDTVFEYLYFLILEKETH